MSAWCWPRPLQSSICALERWTKHWSVQPMLKISKGVQTCTDVYRRVQTCTDVKMAWTHILCFCVWFETPDQKWSVLPLFIFLCDWWGCRTPLEREVPWPAGLCCFCFSLWFRCRALLSWAQGSSSSWQYCGLSVFSCSLIQKTVCFLKYWLSKY